MVGSCFLVPARIVNISKNVSVNEGENVNLYCLAVGRPEPTVTWKDQKCKLPPFFPRLSADSQISCFHVPVIPPSVHSSPPVFHPCSLHLFSPACKLISIQLIPTSLSLIRASSVLNPAVCPI